MTKKQNKKINWLFVGIMILIFLVGVITGTALGIKAGQMMLFEGLGMALKDSNINFTINLNETELVNRINETIMPTIKDIFEEDLG